MKRIAYRLVVSHPAAAAEVAQFCRLKADILLHPGSITEVRWEADPKHPADKLLLITNRLDAHELIELAEYIEDHLPHPRRANAGVAA